MHATTSHAHVRAHAGKPPGEVELDDVMLAIQARSAFSFAQPPDQTEIAQLAMVANDKEMPHFPIHKHGLLIPEDKDSLTAQNYQLGWSSLVLESKDCWMA